MATTSRLFQPPDTEATHAPARLDRSSRCITALPHPHGSGTVAVVLSMGALDRRSCRAARDALRTVQVAAREVGLSCDVGVRTFARALTIRLWALDGARTRTAAERLSAVIARSHGVALVLTGDLAASGGLVDETLAASDHVEHALTPDELAPALARARAVLWPASPRPAAARATACEAAANGRAAPEVRAWQPARSAPGWLSCSARSGAR